MSIERRAFLSLAAVAGATAVFGWQKRAGALPDDWPEADARSFVPGGPWNVLEIFLYGGLCPWDSFYVTEAFIARNGMPELADVRWHVPFPPADVPITRLTGQSFDVTELGVDGAGQRVFFGPATRPLWRANILERTKILVHELQGTPEAHEIAVPIAVSSRGLGRPSACGLGAPIQRFWGDPAGPPVAYVFQAAASVLSPELFAPAHAPGLHASHRPVSLTVQADAGGALADRLLRVERTPLDPERKLDALTRRLRAAYADELRYRAGGVVRNARSQGLSDYRGATASLFASEEIFWSHFQHGAGTILDLPPGTAFRTPVASHTHPDSGQVPSPIARYDHVRASLRAAAALFNRDPRARYACVIDSGLHDVGGTGYDTHLTHTGYHNNNLLSLTLALRELLDADARVRAGVGTDDDRLFRLDLDRTLVVFNTEFGRTPGLNGARGRDHWRRGHVTLFLGGPIANDPDPSRPGRVYGSIGETGYAGGTRCRPVDVHAAALLAAGIDPFAPGNYRVGAGGEHDSVSFQFGSDAATARDRLRDNLLTGSLTRSGG